MPKLSAVFVANVKPDQGKRIEIPDSVVVGLYLVVQASGHRSWAVRYRHQGRPKKLTLGAYPVVTLAAARQAAREALEAVAKGIDPAAAKAAEKTRTFASVAALFISKYCQPRHKDQGRRTEQLLRNHVLPVWGERDFRSVRRDEVNALAWQLVERGPSASNNTLSALRTMWSWGGGRGPRRLLTLRFGSAEGSAEGS